jgi:hypothetical protein
MNPPVEFKNFIDPPVQNALVIDYEFSIDFGK